MEKQQGSPEFVVRRIPEVRVLFDAYDNAAIQLLLGDAGCVFRGTEHRLWLFARAFSRETSEAFAEQATERARGQASRLCVLRDRLDELERELARKTETCLVERFVRVKLQHELVTRDGRNRTERTVSALLDEAHRTSARRKGETA